jgi:hypothetical protein
VFHKPSGVDQYVIGADVAEGLVHGDASCASVLRMKPSGLDLRYRLEAQYHARIDSELYAYELFKLALLYYPSTLVIERNSIGAAVIKTLKDLGCWMLFHDFSRLEKVLDSMDASYGVSTNRATKGVIVSALQGVIKLCRVGVPAITIEDELTLEELENYVQQPTETGRSFRFEGEGGAPDDRPMSIALALYATKTFPVYDFDLQQKLEAAAKATKTQSQQSEETRSFWKTVHEEQRKRLEAEQEQEQFARAWDAWS